MPTQVESAAYHEVGHMTAAVVQGMPIRQSGLHVDLYGNGVADYFERMAGDLGMTANDIIERKRTIIALYAAHAAQLKFYPECDQNGWRNDVRKIKALSEEMYPSDEAAQIAMQADLQERARKLVDVHWQITEELAQVLLATPCTQMSENGWGSGSHERHISGPGIVEFFANHKIPAHIVADNVRNFDSTQIVPYYDSLA